MYEGKSIGIHHIPRIAEKTQAAFAELVPRNVQPPENQEVTLSPMDYKEECGRRIKRARAELGWKLDDLSRETGDLLTLKRINAYENGDRMIGPAEAVILGKALKVRPAYLLAVEDAQLPITPQEEELIRNWRTLNERDRMDIFRSVQSKALQNRDPVPDKVVERHLPLPEPRHIKAVAAKRVRRKTP